MGRQYDLENVEETRFFNEVGNFTVKVISVTQSKTANGNPVEKVTFANRDGMQISDEFVITEKALWKMKIFTKALKLPTVTDTDMWVDRYVVITVGIEHYTKDNGTRGEKFVVKAYAPSSLTNTLAQKEQQVQNSAVKNNTTFNGVEVSVYDISDEEIPF